MVYVVMAMLNCECHVHELWCMQHHVGIVCVMWCTVLMSILIDAVVYTYT